MGGGGGSRKVLRPRQPRCVDGEASPPVGRSGSSKGAARAFLAEAESLGLVKLFIGGRIMDLGDFYIIRAEAGCIIGLARQALPDVLAVYLAVAP